MTASIARWRMPGLVRLEFLLSRSKERFVGWDLAVQDGPSIAPSPLMFHCNGRYKSWLSDTILCCRRLQRRSSRVRARSGSTGPFSTWQRRRVRDRGPDVASAQSIRLARMRLASRPSTNEPQATSFATRHFATSRLTAPTIPGTMVRCALPPPSPA